MRKPFQQYIIHCNVCGESFITKRAHAKTCKKSTCRVILHREKLKFREPSAPLKIEKIEAHSATNKYPETHSSPAPINSEKSEPESSCEFEYYIHTTGYGCLFNFCGYQGVLFSVSPDYDLIKNFENHLVRHEPYPFLAKPDKNKVAALKILLENKRFIIENLSSPGKGFNTYKGKISVKHGTIERPVYVESVR